MDLQKIRQLVKTDCYGEKDEIINEAVLICLETSCDEETAVKLAFKKFKKEFWDKKFNYAASIIDDDGEDLRDKYIFVDKGEEETFNRLDDNLRERGKKLCETACLLGKLGGIMRRTVYNPNKVYFQTRTLTFKNLNNISKSFFRQTGKNPQIIFFENQRCNHFVNMKISRLKRRKKQ